MALVLVGGGLGAWAAIAKLSGAVVAGGTLVVESSVAKSKFSSYTPACVSAFINVDLPTFV